MAAIKKESCVFEGRRIDNGGEICSAELDFADCMVCEDGELKRQPRLHSPNFQERL